jgi:hypothetical protein
LGAKRILALGSVAALCVGAATPLFMASPAGAANVTGVCVSGALQAIVGVAYIPQGENTACIGAGSGTFESIVGPIGAVGPTGPTGASPTGPTGPAGSVGAPGAKGATGPQGPAGVAGAPGVLGATGAAGATGATGAQGASPAGPNGALGATGATGATGPQGPQGPNGPAGAAGATGSDAVNAAITTVNGAGQSTSTNSLGLTTNQDVTTDCATATAGLAPFLVGGGGTIAYTGPATNGDAALVVSYPFPASNLSGTQGGSWVAQAVVTRVHAGGSITVTAHAYCRP